MLGDMIRPSGAECWASPDGLFLNGLPYSNEMAHVGSEPLEAIVLRVVSAIDIYTPAALSTSAAEENGSLVLALAAIHRMADLLRAELLLSMSGRNSATRSLGRTVIELWLNANELLLDPDSAMERLFAEDVKIQAQVQHGLGVMWDRYEKLLDGGIDLRDPNFERGEGQRSNVETLSSRVSQLRKDRGFGNGGLAEFNYQMTYRRDSIEDIHVTLYQLFRYIRPSQEGIEILRQPGDGDTYEFRGPESVRADAQLTSDVLGVYLITTNQSERIEELKAFLRWPSH